MRKRKKIPEKFTPYYELLDALKQDECALCFKVRTAGRSYLDSLLYEHVNDPPLRERLRLSEGFCGRHATCAVQLGDRLGISIIYEDLLSHALAAFDDGGTSPGKTTECPACAAEQISEENYLRLILDFLVDPDFQDAFEDAQAFCLSHWQKLMRLGKRKEGEEFLLRFQREKLKEIREHLREFIRKHDHRFRHEKITQGEATSWQKAIQYFVGTN